jgi:N-acyl-D-aspartate/D-glutamate deacylase
MDRLDRAATRAEIAGMRAQLREALEHGALGLSTGLAYGNAINAPTEEVLALAEPLAEFGGSTPPTCAANSPTSSMRWTKPSASASMRACRW